MDCTDVLILKKLAEDSDVSAADISDSICLSVPAINKRIARLKEEGVVRKMTIITNPGAVEKALMAFGLVKISDYSKSGAFLVSTERERDILECYAVSGEYDYLIKMCAGSINELEDKLSQIKSIGGITSYTMMCLREYKFEAAVLPADPERK